MKRCRFLVSVLVCAIFSDPLQASSRVIVRVASGISAVSNLCGLVGCTVVRDLGDPLGQVFLVTSNLLAPSVLQSALSNLPGVLNCELDLQAKIADATYSIPAALTDTTPTEYYGTTVPNGYVAQPATGIVRLAETQAAFRLSGSGIVAVIDTGVDANHPALSSVLLPGYDFTRNRQGADENRDVSFTESPSTGSPHWVNARTVANVSQSTAAVVDGPPGYADYGHGTMVAGIIHLVAPSSTILPLKVFSSDGTGYTSDILRAIYAAVKSNSQVINMSFSLAPYSQEIKQAVQYANSRGVICVAAAGNDGKQELVYPAALTNLVIGVASTTNGDQRSSFSNYGPQLVWVAAPGEGVVTTYPNGTYAASWGTSFSTPFVAGTAALLVQLSNQCDQNDAAQSIAHAVALGSDLGNGRLDAYQATQTWLEALGGR
jgi:subtilisin family serine protease